ncbi:DEAD/DEAH box helicase [Rhabdothermincola salaria]|uniref:DEAD/DEAH box helicase n=1 Tax=Rhabdothermincola salaria TaxID=2903142 RepID=UPI001E4CAAF6|nr:DEAD/DEAH box helicase [Rhabdothermincola salaria]MCD9624630.1 DEAD/DEAH box helicase [Rhabdothermincola salaria]
MALPADPGLESFSASFGDDPRLVHVERIPARPARTAELAHPLPAPVLAALGVDHFWSHQATAIDLVRAGRSVAVATGTASGKSLCFQAPIAEAVSEGLRPSTALMMFPTKALAQDQLRSLSELEVPRLVAATYDGDCTPEARTWARANANVVLTNPEMLHTGLLPHHARWATFFMRLRYVVVDELHTLRGIFGSHVAHVLRRLRRICAHYGSSPTFIFTSATLGEPHRLASELCGLPVEAVVDDGSPRGERLFLVWNPGADQEATGRSVSSSRDTAELMTSLVEHGHRTIAFCRSRKGTEIVAADVGRRVRTDLAETVRAYRGGYLTAERRDIERRLFSGRLRGVVATSALELGIDVGGLDACILNGFPGTVASMWQQAGRAGREARTSMAILVAGDDQLDQWFVHHPDELFRRPPEPAVVNPANTHTLWPHLACAAYELPLTPADERWWPGLLDDGVRDLVLDDTLRLRPPHHRRGPAAVWARRGWPSRGVGLRNAGGEEFRIAEADGTLVGTVDGGRAFRLVHPGAVYLHQGRAWKVTDLDLDDRVALVEPADGGEYTQPRTTTEISVLGQERRRRVGAAELALGPVRVRSEIIGYRRLDAFTGELLGLHDLDLPPSELVTRAFWYAIPDDVLHAAGLAAGDVPGALHAAEHAGIGILPLFTICDRWDVGGVSTPMLPETGQATIVIYDGYPGGAGVAELGFDAADRHLAATLEVIEQCPCVDGCPSCVQSPKCGNGNEPLDKHGAAALLRSLLGSESDLT